MADLPNSNAHFHCSSGKGAFGLSVAMATATGVADTQACRQKQKLSIHLSDQSKGNKMSRPRGSVSVKWGLMAMQHFTASILILCLAMPAHSFAQAPDKRMFPILFPMTFVASDCTAASVRRAYRCVVVINACPSNSWSSRVLAVDDVKRNG